MKLTFRPIGQWPGQLTVVRKESPFEAPWSSTMSTLDRECAHLQGLNTRQFHAKDCVVQLAVPEGAIRQDGQLAAGRAAPDHPGVILNVDTPSGPLRFSCDRFDAPRGVGWKQNLRAVALGLEALRRVERYGMGSGREQYAGFQALPPGTPMGTAAQPVAMTVDNANRVMGMADGYDAAWLDAGDLEARDVDRAYRALAQQYHPDTGSGNAEQFRMIGEARKTLTEHLAATEAAS